MAVVAGLFYRIKPAVTAIVVQAAYQIGSRVLINNLLLAIAAAVFVAIFAFNVSFPVIVAVLALVGYIGGSIVPDKFTLSDNQTKADKTFGPAIIDDDRPTPDHARSPWLGLIKVVLVEAVLCATPMALLIVTYG